MKPLLMIPVLSAALLLSACAGTIPKADPSKAWISLQAETPNNLLAERVDGKPVSDGRYFEVLPGDHRLDVTFFKEEAGDDNEQDCRGQIEYKDFDAGEHYTLVESSLGTVLRASLMDSRGKELASTEDFDCMPG